MLSLTCFSRRGEDTRHLSYSCLTFLAHDHFYQHTLRTSTQLVNRLVAGILSTCLFFYRFLNAIQTNAQHLVRYLAVAVVVNKRRRNVMKDLMRLIEQESYQTSDPVTDFLRCLFTNYDFDGAQQALQKCEQVQSIALDSFADRLRGSYKCANCWASQSGL